MEEISHYFLPKYIHILFQFADSIDRRLGLDTLACMIVGKGVETENFDKVRRQYKSHGEKASHGMATYARHFWKEIALVKKAVQKGCTGEITQHIKQCEHGVDNL